MAINQTPQQNFNYGFMNQGQSPIGMNYGTPPQPASMMNYGQPMNNTNGMNISSQPGLSIVSVTSDDQILNYPVASGNTVEFINFNTNRLCFKSTNQNGVSMPLRWATFSYDEQQQMQNQPQNFNNQNDVNSVSREEFDELRSMMVQTLGMLKEQQDDRQYRPRKNTYNGGGKRNDRSENVSADDQ